MTLSITLSVKMWRRVGLMGRSCSTPLETEDPLALVNSIITEAMQHFSDHFYFLNISPYISNNPLHEQIAIIPFNGIPTSNKKK